MKTNKELTRPKARAGYKKSSAKSTYKFALEHIDKATIDKYLLLNNGGENENGIEFTKLFCLKKFVEGKYLIERWDQSATDLIIHTSHETMLRKICGEQYGSSFYSEDLLWGMHVHYSDDMPLDKAIMLARKDKDTLTYEQEPSKSISVIPLEESNAK